MPESITRLWASTKARSRESSGSSRASGTRLRKCTTTSCSSRSAGRCTVSSAGCAPPPSEGAFLRRAGEGPRRIFGRAVSLARGPGAGDHARVATLRPTPTPDGAGPAGTLLAGLSAAKLLIHVLLANRYGYFRDELYFLDCGRHLDWGYVDHAPLIGLVARFALFLRGSLPALRAFPPAAGPP